MFLKHYFIAENDSQGMVYSIAIPSLICNLYALRVFELSNEIQIFRCLVVLN